MVQHGSDTVSGDSAAAAALYASQFMAAVHGEWGPAAREDVMTPEVAAVSCAAAHIRLALVHVDMRMRKRH